MFCQQFTLRNKQELLPEHYLLQVEAPEIAKIAQPGQFAQIRCGKTLDPLLRRPISIHGADPQTGLLSFLFRVVGRGTQLLAETKVGEKLDLMAPLGQGFNLPQAKQKVALIGGGIGAAPLRFLAEKLPNCDFFLGVANQQFLLPASYFGGVNYYPATDDGSFGYSGLVTDLFQEKLQKGEKYDIFYACGPTPMLKAVSKIAAKFNLSGQVSLEEKMACGLGVCLSCVTKIKDSKGKSFSHQRVCREGPVFNWQEVEWC